MDDTDKRTELQCRITATVEVEVLVNHEHSGTSQFEKRALKVTLSERLNSSADIREAFNRLAEIAVQGATR